MSISENQRELYLRLFREHGEDPQSLSHRDEATQAERFARLTKAFENECGAFTVHEIGCGLGHLGDILKSSYPKAVYSGSEICSEFVDICRGKFLNGSFFMRDVSAETPADRYDFLVLSGTFNIRLGETDERWMAFIHDMLNAMYAMCEKGMAVNFLTTYNDPEYRRDDLHYQDPKDIVHYAATSLSRHLEIDAAGPLYEFALRVYRPEYVRELYPGDEFLRYFDNAKRTR